MKKGIIIMVALVLYVGEKAYSQNLTVTNMVTLSNAITSTFDNNSSQINNAIDAWLMKGFLLNQFRRFTTTSTNVITTYALFQNNDLTNNEEFSIETDIIPPQGAIQQRKICSIEFFTSDFATFEKWFNDLSTNAAYTLSLHQQVSHTYQYGVKTIQVGESAIHPSAPPGQIVTEDWKFDNSNVNRYYLTIQYPVAQ